MSASGTTNGSKNTFLVLCCFLNSSKSRLVNAWIRYTSGLCNRQCLYKAQKGLPGGKIMIPWSVPCCHVVPTGVLCY